MNLILIPAASFNNLIIMELNVRVILELQAPWVARAPRKEISAYRSSVAASSPRSGSRSRAQYSENTARQARGWEGKKSRPIPPWCEPKNWLSPGGQNGVVAVS